MLKSLTLKRGLIGLATTATLAGGGLLAFETLADHSVTWTDAQTFIVAGAWRRDAVNSVVCSGRCRTATASGQYQRTYPVNASAATLTGCISSLSALCVANGGADDQ